MHGAYETGGWVGDPFYLHHTIHLAWLLVSWLGVAPCVAHLVPAGAVAFPLAQPSTPPLSTAGRDEAVRIKRWWRKHWEDIHRLQRAAAAAVEEGEVALVACGRRAAAAAARMKLAASTGAL